MRRILVIATGLVLSGCAMNSAGLMRRSVTQVVQSTRSSQSFATCVAEHLNGNNPLRNEGDHYWVLRLNGYQVPIMRWDFYPNAGGGSRAELRSSFGMMTGNDKVEQCAAP